MLLLKLSNPLCGFAGLTVAIVAGLLMVSGCQRTTFRAPQESIRIPVRQFSSGTAAFERIAILRLENGTRNSQLEPQARTALTAAMREVYRGEVVDIGSQVRQACDLDSVLRNGYPLQLLAETWRGFHADGILFTRIDEFNAYQPMSFGLTMHLVDTRDASLHTSLSHHWSLADPQTRNDYRAWLNDRFPDCRDTSLYLSSPTIFIEFIMRRIAKQL